MKQAIEIDLKIRPYAGDADVPAIADIFNGELKADGVPNFEAEGEVRAWLSNPSESFDAKRDVDIAEVDGRPVAFVEREWIDTTDGKREYRINGAVLPQWRRQGIGTALYRRNIERVNDIAATHATDRPKILGSWSSDRQAGRVALLREQGFEPVRWFFDMIRDLSEPIPDVPLPDGIEVRPVTMDNIRQIWKADSESFKDHWGGFDDSDARLKSWIDSPTFEPDLWVIAWDGDEVAAGVTNLISPEENEALGVKRGWLATVFTRRPWRKRGLANALIARSLANHRARGMDYGVLGVDAENPTGALGLYERNGFKVLERSTAWRKPLE